MQAVVTGYAIEDLARGYIREELLVMIVRNGSNPVFTGIHCGLFSNHKKIKRRTTLKFKKTLPIIMCAVLLGGAQMLSSTAVVAQESTSVEDSTERTDNADTKTAVAITEKATTIKPPMPSTVCTTEAKTLKPIVTTTRKALNTTTKKVTTVKPTAKPKTTKAKTTKVKTTDIYDSIHYGILSVPEAGLRVNLYDDCCQETADRPDSAAIFSFCQYRGKIIADYCNQEFRNLFSVRVGTTGTIQLDNGNTIHIKCVKIIDGYNTESDIVDENHKSVLNTDTDYLMYTCRNGWQEIRICLWEVV